MVVLPTRFELISMVPETIILSIELREHCRRKYKIIPLFCAYILNFETECFNEANTWYSGKFHSTTFPHLITAWCIA